MSLRDNRAADRQCGGGVATCDTECQRKVARSEDGHRTQRNETASNGGSAIRLVDHRLEVGPLLDDVRQESELRGRAGDFSLEAWSGTQGCLGVGDGDDPRGVLVECVRNRVQQAAPLGRCPVAQDGGGVGGVAARIADVLGRGLVNPGCADVSGSWVDALDRRRPVGPSVVGEEVGSGQFDCVILSRYCLEVVLGVGLWDRWGAVQPC